MVRAAGCSFFVQPGSRVGAIAAGYRIGAVRMRLRLCLLFAPLAVLHSQPPAITQEGVRNLASQMPPSLPGGALSPGAWISVRGLRLGSPDGKTRVVFRQNGSEIPAELLVSKAEYLEV